MGMSLQCVIQPASKQLECCDKVSQHETLVQPILYSFAGFPNVKDESSRDIVTERRQVRQKQGQIRTALEMIGDQAIIYPADLTMCG